MTACVRPPFCFGYFSPSLAPKEEKRNVPEMIIYLGYNLAAYYGAGSHEATRVNTRLSGREHTIWPPVPKAQTAPASALLRRLPVPALLTAGAARVTALAP